MLNIKLVVVGKLKEKFHKEEVSEYLKRLSKYAKVSIIEVEEEKNKDNSSLKENEQILIKEGNNVLKHIKDNEYLFLLDLHGKEISSEEFAKKMNDLPSSNYSTINFVIGIIIIV